MAPAAGESHGVVGVEPPRPFKEGSPAGMDAGWLREMEKAQSIAWFQMPLEALARDSLTRFQPSSPETRERGVVRNRSRSRTGGSTARRNSRTVAPSTVIDATRCALRIVDGA